MFTLKGNKFYYIEIINKKLKRHNVLSEILDENYTQKKLYLKSRFAFDLNEIAYTNKLHKSIITKSDIYIKELKEKLDEINLNNAIAVVKTIDRDCFLKSIPDIEETNNTNYNLNLRLKKEELEYLEEIKSKYKCISAYKEPDNIEKWMRCSICNLQPLVWEFDNGRSTACGCGENEYNHFSVEAQSIMSVYTKTKSTAEYDSDELRKNWNHWVKTGKHSFKKNLEKSLW